VALFFALREPLTRLIARGTFRLVLKQKPRRDVCNTIPKTMSLFQFRFDSRQGLAHQWKRDGVA
jgi:hypothetical protein